MDWEQLLIGRPFLTNDQVMHLVKEQYGLDVTKLKALVSYDNQNFKIEASSTSRIDINNKYGTTFVLKVTNSCLSENSQSLILGLEVMEFLNERDFKCSLPVPTLDGKVAKLLSFKKNLTENGDSASNQELEATFLVRLLTYLPGVILNELSCVPNNAFEEWGESLAKIHLSLQKIKLDTAPFKYWGQKFVWSLDLVGKCRTLLHLIDDPERQKMAREVIEAYEGKVLPRKQELPQGLLHGDFNDQNLLASKLPLESGEDGIGELHVTGFIDFDDMVHGPLVNDVGTSLMYVLQCRTQSRHHAASLFLRSYSNHRELSPTEKGCLFYCTAARCVQSLIGGLYSYSMSKNVYVLSTQQRGWDALKEIWREGKENMYKQWQFR